MTQTRTVLLLGPARDSVSGVSTHVNQLFASSLAQDHRLVHFQVGSEGRVESRVGKLLRLAASPVQLMWHLVRERVAIVHVNTSLNPKAFWRDVAYVLVAKLLRRRVVYQVHGGDLPEAFVAGSRPLAGLLRTVLHMTDAVVLLAQRELHAYQAFAPALRVRRIANAIDLPPDPVHKSAAATGPLVLVYVGRLVREKGVFDLIEAVAQILRSGVVLRLVVAGLGADEGAMRARVTELGLDGNITFAGPVFGARKTELLNSADLFGFPTRADALPYALLESMAARTPVVICPVGAIPDVVEDGVHGIFVAPGDVAALREAIVRLDGDRALLQSMALACRKRVESGYSLMRLAADFRALYAELYRY